MKTAAELMTSVVEYIKSTIGNVDTRVGTYLRDAILTPLVSIVADLYTALGIVQGDQGVDTSSGGVALDRLAANYNIFRLTGTFANGPVRFYLYDTHGVDFTVPANTIITANNASQSITYTTTTAGIILATTAPIESNIDSPFYGYPYVEVSAVCTQAGVIGNVGSGSIRLVSISGLSGVDNPSDFTNGSDTQDDAALAARIKSTARGNIGTITGYESLILSNYSFKDVKVIKASDPDCVRGQESGAIDIIVLSDSISRVSETVSAAAEFIPTSLPLLSVTRVSLAGVDLAAGITSGYSAYLDTESIYRRSTKELSSIEILEAIPSGATMTIEYISGPDVLTVQTFMEADANNVIGSDVLVRSEVTIPTGMVANITVVPGYDAIAIRDAVSTAVDSYFSGLLLGTTVDKTDIINVMYTVTGLDSVEVASFKFGRLLNGVILDSVNGRVASDKNEHIILESRTIN